MHNQNIIEPKNLPMWTAAGFIVALLAMGMSMTVLYRSTAAAMINQAHVLLLNQKIEALTQQVEKNGLATPLIKKP
jgi:hypothetical protein